MDGGDSCFKASRAAVRCIRDGGESAERAVRRGLDVSFVWMAPTRGDSDRQRLVGRAPVARIVRVQLCGEAAECDAAGGDDARVGDMARHGVHHRLQSRACRRAHFLFLHAGDVAERERARFSCLHGGHGVCRHRGKGTTSRAAVTADADAACLQQRR
jgi:hypothetical protein